MLMDWCLPSMWYVCYHLDNVGHMAHAGNATALSTMTVLKFRTIFHARDLWKKNPYNITKQIQCTYRTTFKTIRATEIVRSARFKCLEGLFSDTYMDHYLDSFIVSTLPLKVHNTRRTRQRDQLRVDRSRINLADNRICIFLPILVNSTPLDLLHKITTHSIQGFSSNIKRYLINRYRDNCSNTNCYMCQY